MKRLILFALCVLSICPAMVESAKFMPLVKNLLPETIMRGQSYSCTQDASGKLFFGGNGMIEFNGTDWIHHPIPGESLVRVVKTIGDRIYVGSYEEFGYFEPDATGQYTYRSLSDHIGKKILSDCEVWKIHELGNRVLFYSYNSIFIYDGKKVSRLKLQGRHAIGMFRLKDNILIQLEDGTLIQLDRNLRLAPLYDGGKFPVLANIAETTHGSRYYLSVDGSFMFQKNKDSDMEPIATDTHNVLKRATVTDALVMNDSVLVVSTRRDGVFAMRADGTLLWHHNLRTGLCSNEVLSLANDSSGNIWCTTDHGISIIYTSLPLSTLITDPSEPQIGVVNGIAKHNDKIYLATSQGSYCLDMRSMSLTELLNTSCFMWHADAFDKNVIIGGPNLTILNGNDYETYDHESTSIIQSADKQHYFGSNYNGIQVWKAFADGTIDESSGYMLPGFKATLHSVLEDYDGTLWATHIANGIYRLVLNHDKTGIAELSFFPSLNSKNERRKIAALKLQGRVYLADADSLYSYSRETGEIKPYKRFCDDLPMIRQIKSVSEVDPHKFWIATADGYYLIGYDGKHYHNEYEIPLKFFSIHNSGQSHNILIDNNDRVYFAATDGILMFNGKSNANGSGGNTPVLSFAKITTIETPENEQYLPVRTDADPSVAGNITFNMAFVNFSNKKYRFRYILSGRTSSTHVSEDCSVTYGNLKPGRYVFKAELLDIKSNVIQTISYKFNVTAPLFLRPWMIIIYLLLAVAIIYASTKISIYYMEKNRKKRERQKQLEDNVKTLQEGNESLVKHSEILKEKLNDKNKDIAELALKEAERNSKIEELQRMLINQERRVSTTEIDKLINNIKSDFSDQDFWKLFQANFDLIHNNYFVRLRRDYPSLTSVDLRFCALLRLNMTTKDIAHMTNLSVRGVETARYRLRRKFGLESKYSLTQFLIDFDSKNLQNEV